MMSEQPWELSDLKITGLDLSLTSPGIGHLRSSNSEISTLSIKTTSDEPWHIRIHRVAKGITEQCERFEPNFIFIENYSFNSKFGRELAGEVHGVVLYLLHKAGFDNTFRVIAPTQLKQYVANNTKATKKQVIEAVLELYGVKFKQAQNDQADALSLAKIGEQLVLREAGIITENLLKHQQVVIEKAQETLRSDSTWLKMFNQM